MRLFVSYAHEDYRAVDEIVAILRDIGFQVWWDRKLLVHQDWLEGLGNEIAGSDALLYFMSPPSVQSTWCHWELGQAATLKKRVIPVLLRDCVIPEVVKNIQFADFRQGANAEAIGSLANGLYRTIEISTAYALEAPEPDGLPPNYYSVFISFSSEDMEFAYRLYEDLRKNGVECYFSPEDLKIGDKFWDEIEEKIQRYDKLLVILSESSVGSDWVRDEVEGGLERERENDEKVLFPIRLDNSVTDSRARWARRIHRKRHIGDFTQWKEHDAYQRSFRRLLRDLEPSNE